MYRVIYHMVNGGCFWGHHFSGTPVIHQKAGVMLNKKLTRESLAEQVAQSLTDYIYTTLEPDDVLPSTAKLAEEYEVSRIVIREALKYLEAQDIIEIANGKRARVKPISGDLLRNFFQRATQFEKKTLLELLEVRRGIEIESARLAALRRTPEEVAAMTAIVNNMQQYLSDPEPFAELDLELHQTIATATGNSMLFYLVDTIRDAQKETILEGLYSRFTNKYFVEIHAIHAKIVAAIEAGNPEQAQQAMIDHFVYAEKAVGHEAPDSDAENEQVV